MWAIIPSGTIFSEELKTLPYVMSTITAGGAGAGGKRYGSHGHFDDPAHSGVYAVPKECDRNHEQRGHQRLMEGRKW